MTTLSRYTTRKQLMAKIAEYEQRKAFWYDTPYSQAVRDNLARLQAEEDKLIDALCALDEGQKGD